VYEPRAPIPLVVVDKENGGRSDALNAAIVYARGPLVAVVDADEVVAHDTLARAIDPFLADPDRTVAAGASLGIANGCRVVRGRLVERRRPRTLLPLYQAVEYERAFRLSRVAASAFRAMPIISGGFGLFRRDLVLAAGGYETDTLGEDFDLTVRLHRFCRDAGLRYRIAQVPEVVCWTLVPNSPRVLRRQRRRWQRGLQQVLGKHRDLLFRPRYRGIGLVALPWAAAFELLNPLIVVLATLVTALCLVIGLMGWPTLVLGLFVTWVVVVAPTLGALLMTESPGGSSTGWRNLGATVGVALVDFPYQWLTLVYRLEAMLLPRRSSTWGEMERSLPGEP
jgi:cellulose synthase/poly-beta-1,6-N-acetylglucosamine synthase-like glycosyltransferase